MAETPEHQLSRQVSNAWADSMDHFFEKLDKLQFARDWKEEDVIDAVRRNVDSETADAYVDWLSGY